MPKKAQAPDGAAVGGVELLTPDNPPPAVDDASVPLFNEAHEAKKSGETLDPEVADRLIHVSAAEGLAQRKAVGDRGGEEV